MSFEIELFEYGAAMRPIVGEEISGDKYLVHSYTGGALFAVVDGAGHGPEAASAASKAMSVLESRPDVPVDVLLCLCHTALQSTRGAAITLASFVSAPREVRWAGVGNVEGFLLRANTDIIPSRESLLLRNGVVGYRFSSPRISSCSVQCGDMLILVTDGISSYFLEEINLSRSCQAIADSILDQHAKDTDDALVLVVRFVEDNK